MILLANKIAAKINVKLPLSSMSLFSDWDVGGYIFADCHDRKFIMTDSTFPRITIARRKIRRSSCEEQTKVPGNGLNSSK